MLPVGLWCSMFIVHPISLCFVCQASAVLIWNRVSDCTISAASLMDSDDLARPIPNVLGVGCEVMPYQVTTLHNVVNWRFLAGALNDNRRGMSAEITDTCDVRHLPHSLRLGRECHRRYVSRFVLPSAGSSNPCIGLPRGGQLLPPYDR
jgi:hypothetical protein